MSDPHRPGVVPVEVTGLSHDFGEGNYGVRVLTDVTLVVEPGELAVMTGPSGSGKTTLLTLIGALRTVQEGSVRVLGSELRGLGEDDLVRMRRSIGFLFQHHNLFPSLTAQQNVRMALELAEVYGDEADRRAMEILGALGLAERAHARPARLSGGQRQRVAVARAVVNRPALILADEPTAALDEESALGVVRHLRGICDNDGAATIIVTHDARILDFADRVINLVDGRVVSNVAVEESVILSEFLTRCPVFSGLDSGSISELAGKMQQERFDAGETVVRQGDAGDKFFVIRSGSAEVVVQTEGARNVVAVLGEADFFGETALLTGEPRNASVIARDALRAYAMDKATFTSVTEHSPSFRQRITRALFQRQ